MPCLRASLVNPLPPTVSEIRFLVSWDGQDDAGGSGIASYDVHCGSPGAAKRSLFHGRAQRPRSALSFPTILVRAAHGSQRPHLPLTTACIWL